MRQTCSFFFLLLLLFFSATPALAGTPAPADRIAAAATDDAEKNPLSQDAVAAMQEGNGFAYSQEQLAYLEQKQQITMCIDPDWMPLESIENGKHIGMTAHYFQIFQEKIPVPITLVHTSSWTESIAYAKQRKCDIFSLAMSTPERETYMDFTRPYLSIPLVMAAKMDRPFIDDITTLPNIKLGVVSGYAFGELLRTRHPNMNIVDVDSVDIGLQQVAEGALDGFIGTLATVGYAIQKRFPTELKVAGKFDSRWELGVATRNDEPILVTIFEKIIASIERQEHQDILNQWIAVKFEQGKDYTMFWQTLFLSGFGIALLLYRNYALRDYNKKLSAQNEKISRQKMKLQEAEKQLLLTQHAVDFCAMPILWVIHGTTLSDTEVIHVNQAAAHLLGYTSAQMLHHGLDLLDAELDNESWQQGLQALHKDSSLPLKTTYRRQDGSTLPVDLFASAFTYQGQEYLFLFLIDITRQLELEKKLHRSMKMESIGLMAGGVAHDLNNILSGIIGYPELLLLELPKDSPFREPIEAIRASGKRAADVVTDLLTVARGVAAEKSSANLNTLVSDYLRSPEYITVAKRHAEVTCSTDLSPDLLNIICSPVHIKKCLMNLVTNGMEAIDSKGSITIRTTNQYIEQPLPQNRFMAPGEYVLFSIADTGPGISPVDIEHIFEPFYTKKKMGRSGTGLGLAVVWNTVEDHGGAITVSSGEYGTTFHLYFPATRKPLDSQLAEEPAIKLQGTGQTILVVDDEPQQRDIAAKLLASLGYKPTTVSSGEEAVQYLQTNTVDLVLLDMIMDPGMNGRRTYEAIAAIHPGQKALIASGYSKNEEVEKALKLGVRQFIKKPYLRNQIGLAVSQVLDG